MGFVKFVWSCLRASIALRIELGDVVKFKVTALCGNSMELNINHLAILLNGFCEYLLTLTKCQGSMWRPNSPRLQIHFRLNL